MRQTEHLWTHRLPSSIAPVHR
uniref:Uncharacterized protein n=1 Tax=Anopheles albimanus TaxID=7167 RepID=A0A182FY68_ANOAL